MEQGGKRLYLVPCAPCTADPVGDTLSSIIADQASGGLVGQEGHDILVLHHGVLLSIRRCAGHSLSDYTPVFVKPDPGPCDAIEVGLADTIPGARWIVPMVQVAADYALHLAKALSAPMVAWQPGQIVSDRDFFEESLHAWQGGGAFPLLNLLRLDMDGTSVTTQGLSGFTGREVRLTGAHLSPAERVRRLARVVTDLVRYPDDPDPTTVPGLSPGEKWHFQNHIDAAGHALCHVEVTGGGQGGDG